MVSSHTLVDSLSTHISPHSYSRCFLRAQPKVQTERAEMNPCSQGIILSEYFRDEAPLDVSAQFRNTFERIDPRRFRLLQQNDQWVGKEGGFAPQTHRVRQDATSGLAQQLLVGTPRQRWQSQQEIDQSQIKKRMAKFQW